MTSITRYRPGPVEAAAPPPEKRPLPRMGKPTENFEQAVWRVKQAELGEIFQWMIPKLQEKYPKLSERGLESWMGAATHEPKMLFIRTAHVVGLFIAEWDVFDPTAPVVYQRFVRSKLKAPQEDILLYLYARNWAISIKARSFEIDSNTDAGLSERIIPAMYDLQKGYKVSKSSLHTVHL